ncbi:MAG: flagellar basal-body MS-ring/collar protein FliF [Thermodesulfobacteriota bacterium]
MGKLIESFTSMNAARKATFFVLFAAAISAIVVLMIWAAKPEYQLLYSKVSEADSADIIEKLRAKKIDYEVGAGGSISVPADRVYETRLELAAEGIPKGGGVGFEIFDKSGFGVTEFVQKVNYKRALQGELSRTIAGLSEVESARIHIVTPEKRLFARDKDLSRASVVLKLNTGRRLNAEQVQGVVNLVSGSVDGLSPGSVTVIDTQGRLLTRAASDDSITALSSTQLEHQRSIEKGLEQRIQEILEPVVGVGKVIARVTADVNFKQVERTEERYDPDSAVVRSEQLSKEKTGDISTGGVPGVVSNIPGRSASAGKRKSGRIGSERQNETVNYEINKVVSRTVEPTGIVNRISVAVLVDGSYDGSGSNYTARTTGEIEKYQNLIKGAVGYTLARGDSVEVVNIPFESHVPMEFDGVKESAFERYLPTVVRYGTLLIMLLLVLFLVIKPLLANLANSGPVFATEGAGAYGARTTAGAAKTPERSLVYSEAEDRLGGGGGMDIEEEIETPGVRTPEFAKKRRIQKVVKDNPQRSASVMKAWLRERGTGGGE